MCAGLCGFFNFHFLLSLQCFRSRKTRRYPRFQCCAPRLSARVSERALDRDCFKERGEAQGVGGAWRIELCRVFFFFYQYFPYARSARWSGCAAEPASTVKTTEALSKRLNHSAHASARWEHRDGVRGRGGYIHCGGGTGHSACKWERAWCCNYNAFLEETGSNLKKKKKKRFRTGFPKNTASVDLQWIWVLVNSI